MQSFFWLTLIASILGLIHAFSKGESDGWDVAKVIIAAVIMIALLVNWFVNDEDALEPKKNDINKKDPIRIDPNRHSDDIRNSENRSNIWQDELDKKR